MAGYKQAVLNYNPVCFLTFDGDSFDAATFALTATPALIFDESLNGNDAIFHQDQTTYQGYMMGRTSLVSLEPGGQYSLSLGYNGGYPAFTTTFWPKTYLEIPNTSSFEFPNNGSFSVMLLIEKMGNESTFRSFWSDYYSPGGSNVSDLYRTVISKGSYLNIQSLSRWIDSKNYLVVTGPDGVTFTVPFDTSGLNSGDVKHVTYTWEVVPNMPTSRWKSTSTLYLNGIQVAQNINTYIDVFPNTNTADSFYIGGTPAAPTSDYNDRTTEDTRFDQISVFDYSLTPYQVQFFYKKTVSYQNLIMTRNPAWVVPFNEPEVAGNYNINAVIGVNGVSQGGAAPTTTVRRQQPGPSNIPGSSATMFTAGGQAYFNNPWPYPNIYTPGGDFTIDFWFTCSSASRGVLFSQYDGDFNYNGMLLQINFAHNTYTPGAIQFSVDDQTYVVSTIGSNFSDGFFHYVCMVRRGMTIELWIDGILQGSTAITSISTTIWPPAVSMFNMSPGTLWVQGSVAWLVAQSAALTPAEIWGRYNYAVIYLLKGTITLEGVPCAATIRLYNHVDGSLMMTTTSSSVDGSYILYPPVNTQYDMMIVDLNDSNVRYRAYGPLIPSTFDDPPV